MPGSTPSACQNAVNLASEAEELCEEERWLPAIEKFEASAQEYVRAALQTNDTQLVQSLRLIAKSQVERAHELRLRLKLHDLVVSGEAFDGGVCGNGGGTDGGAKQGSGSEPSASAEALEASRVFARISSQLISTHEELRFGVEELVRLLGSVGSPASTAQTASSAMAGSALMGAKLMDSFCVVSPGSGSGSARFAQTQPSAYGAASASSSIGGSDARSGGAGSVEGDAMAQLTAENSRLTRENAALRQRATDVRSQPDSAAQAVLAFGPGWSGPRHCAIASDSPART